MIGARWRTVGMTLLAGLVAALSAGCAERVSHQQYQKQLDRTAEEVSIVTRDIAQRPSTDTRWFALHEQRLRDMADDLKATDPPSDVTQAHETWVDGVRGLSRLLGTIGDCARLEQSTSGAADPCRRAIGESRLDEVRNDLDEARTIFRDAGYRVR